MMRILIPLILLAAPAIAGDGADARRLEVLFLGDDGHHRPLDRYRVLKQALGTEGFNLTFAEDLETITRPLLDGYDALIVYANHEADEVPEAIVPWVRDGGGLVALHSACGNFHPSEEWFDLVGGRFESHGEGVFRPRTVDTGHPVTRDLPVLECWDETYRHRDLAADRHLLQVRDPIGPDESEPEPWTWTRNEGRGRVFYTASGHDLRCWEKQAYQELVKRAILWSVGEARAAAFGRLELPALETEVPQVGDRTHPDIPMMELQKPLSPAASAAHTQVPVGTRLVLFASEPMVRNPIAIDWDPLGRAWVVESFGYPNDVPDEPGSGGDTIKILEDTDGDGAADRMTVFAEGLRHCTTTAFVGNGVVATDGREIVYLGDEDGDGKAEVRKVLAGGLNVWDTHASTSNFLYGFDNRIHATVGYSGVEMRVGGNEHRFAQAVFRFRPDLSELEFLQSTTNNTWGLGFTERGDITGSTANNNPSWIMSIPAAAYADTGLEQPKTPRLDSAAWRAPDDGEPRMPLMHTNTRDVTQVDQIDGFTAAAGHQYYTDRVLAGVLSPQDVMICEPTGHIVAIGEHVDEGSLGRTRLRGNNVFASADAWSAPVAARVGPDGAVWIADWYNPIVQHNVVFRYRNPARGYDQPHSPYQTGDEKGPGKGNAYVTPLRDRDHGRIWRVVPADGSVRKPDPLDRSDAASLLAGLASPSQLVRLHAQRLLVERGKTDVVPDLERLAAAQAGNALAAVHAVRTLEGLGATASIVPLVASPDPLVRRHVIEALGAGHPAVAAALPGLVSSTAAARDLLPVLSTAARAPRDPALAEALWKRLGDGVFADPTLREAATLVMRRQGPVMLSAAAAHPVSEVLETWYGKALMGTVTRLAGGDDRAELSRIAGEAPAGLRDAIGAVLAAPVVMDRKPVEVPERFHAGRDAYMKACVECHQADGRGVERTFPPLVGSEWVTGGRGTMIRIMLGGLSGPVEVGGTAFDGVMPGHSHSADAEIAEIASFVRHAFGGLDEEPVTAAEVKAVRPEIEARKFVPWTVPELLKAAGK